MSNALNELLLAALQRAGKPRRSDDVLDDAIALALADGWEPGQVSALNRRSVAKRLQDMTTAGTLQQTGVAMDEASRRTTPVYAPAAGYNLRAAAPEPPPARRPPPAASPYEGLEKSQLIALLDVHDALAQVNTRFMRDLSAWREQSRARLMAVGLRD